MTEHDPRPQDPAHAGGASVPPAPPAPPAPPGYGSAPGHASAPGYADAPAPVGAPGYGSAPGYADAPAPVGAPGYAPGYPNAAGSGSAWGRYSSWGSRVGASLLDSLLSMIPLVVVIPGVILLVTNSPDTSRAYDPITGTYESVTTGGNGAMMAVGGLIIAIGYLLAFAVVIWNRYLKMGRTGQSWGKKVMGQKLVHEQTGQPIGALMAFVRDLAHTLDSLFGTFPLGYLWPLWDAKRQTWADKLLTTVVVDVPKH